MMFLDCPAWWDQDGTVRCGFPPRSDGGTPCAQPAGPSKAYDQVPCWALVQRAQRIPRLGKQRQASAGPCRSRCQCRAVGMAAWLTRW